MAARSLSMRHSVHTERALCTAPRHSPRVYRGARATAGRVHAMAVNNANPPPLVKVRRRVPRISRTDISPMSIATDARGLPARPSPPNCGSDHGRLAVAAYERLSSIRHGWLVCLQSWRHWAERHGARVHEAYVHVGWMLGEAPAGARQPAMMHSPGCTSPDAPQETDEQGAARLSWFATEHAACCFV
jgi:hypothetical protein